MKVYHMNGAGNDFMVLDARGRSLNFPELARRLCAKTGGDPWADADSLREEMRALRYDPAFPKGANVNYYCWIAPGEVKMLTFERGVEDFTLACGTGCGSTAAVLNRKGLLPGGILTAHNRGGVLKVTVTGDPEAPELYLEGPTEITEIFEIPETEL